MLSTCSGPAGQKRHSQAREGPRMAEKALPGRFTPDCGERTISVGTSPRFGSSFRGWGCSVSIGGEPVAIADLIRGGLGCSQMLALCSLMLALCSLLQQQFARVLLPGVAFALLVLPSLAPPIKVVRHTARQHSAAAQHSRHCSTHTHMGRGRSCGLLRRDLRLSAGCRQR